MGCPDFSTLSTRITLAVLNLTHLVHKTGYQDQKNIKLLKGSKDCYLLGQNTTWKFWG